MTTLPNVSSFLSCSAGYYFSGDGAHRHSNGYYQITGRTDDVINVSGHRLGTAEVEDAMVRVVQSGPKASVSTCYVLVKAITQPQLLKIAIKYNVYTFLL